MLTFKRKTIAGGILHRQILIWRNKNFPLGKLGAWHVFIHNKQIAFCELTDALTKIDKYHRAKKKKPPNH